MNTTARIESTGEKNKIHLSQATADLLIQSGKKHWVITRKDKVVAKGKVSMTQVVCGLVVCLLPVLRFTHFLDGIFTTGRTSDLLVTDQVQHFQFRE